MTKYPTEGAELAIARAFDEAEGKPTPTTTCPRCGREMVVKAERILCGLCLERTEGLS